MNDFIKVFDSKFIQLHNLNCEIIDKIPAEKLFVKPTSSYIIFSSGEYILRSAAKVEQTFGGIMTRLWDDPFEWTLPEELSSKNKIVEYLKEVEDTRLKGFAFFTSDNDLQKEIPAPNKMKSLFELLLDTLVESKKLQGNAILVNRLNNGEKILS